LTVSQAVLYLQWPHRLQICCCGFWRMLSEIQQISADSVCVNRLWLRPMLQLWWKHLLRLKDAAVLIMWQIQCHSMLTDHWNFIMITLNKLQIFQICNVSVIETKIKNWTKLVIWKQKEPQADLCLKDRQSRLWYSLTYWQFEFEDYSTEDLLHYFWEMIFINVST